MLRIIFYVFFLLFPTLALAGITFNDGSWESSFDCPAWEHPNSGWYDPCPDESGLRSRGGTVDGKKTQITADANFPGGAGGKGARFWKGSGADNRLSAAMRITFETRQPELWVRWYFRYESGFKWVYGAGAGTKEIYWNVITDSSEGASAYTGIMDTTVRTVNQSGSRIDGNLVYPSSGGKFGWNHVYPGSVSDGSWHCMEVYMLIDSGKDKFDGAGRIWVDGNLVAERTNMNWSGGGNSAGLGWSWFEFLQNQKDPGLERAYYADVDDMVIYNQTPPNRDAQGNPFIGPLPPTPPWGLSIDVQ